MSFYFFRPLSYVAICLMFLTLSGQAKVFAQDEPTLQVTASATQVDVGDTVTVTGILSGLGQPQYTLQIETSPGLLQDINQPIFTPAQPAANSTGTFTLTAARAGTVTFSMSANGEVADTDDDGNTVFFRTTVGGRSGAVTVAAGPAEPVTIPEPLTITLFATGLAGMAGYARQKRK